MLKEFTRFYRPAWAVGREARAGRSWPDPGAATLDHAASEGRNKDQAAREAAVMEGEKMTEKTFEVEGMSCGHCNAAVEGELGKLEGVERSNANFETGIVEVSYDEARVGVDDLKGAIEEAGYEVKA